MASMDGLDGRDTAALAERGITIDVAGGGVTVSITPEGLYWLANRAYQPGRQSGPLTAGLLKEAAELAPDGDTMRQLRIRAVPLPTYGEKDDYWAILFYLNESGPGGSLTCLYAGDFQSPRVGIGDGIRWPFTIDGNTQAAYLAFSGEEYGTLLKGGIVAFPPGGGGH